MMPRMKSNTVYRTFTTAKRRELIRITEDVQRAVDDAGIAEGMALVSAMHITAGVWVNDDEPGLHEDTLEWLDKVAPPSWKPPANEVAKELLQVIVPVTAGRLDLGPWQQVFYAEFDGRRAKRLIIKVLGE